MSAAGWRAREPVRERADLHSAQRPERLAHLFTEQLWLLPSSEVTASVEFLEVNEVVGICALCPTPWRRGELIREDTNGKRDGDVLCVEEVGLILPIEACRGYPRVRQPIE